jgi:Ca2+-binding RTX toxin-like protein
VTFTNSLDQISNPSFSADGTKLIFGARLGGQVGEIWSVGAAAPGGVPVNLTNTPTPLRDEGPTWQSLHRCAGRAVTIVGDDGPDKIKGTKRADVIAAFGGKDKIVGRGGSDRICAGPGKDKIVGGGGKKDLCRGEKGKDKGFKGCERGKL